MPSGDRGAADRSGTTARGGRAEQSLERRQVLLLRWKDASIQLPIQPSSGHRPLARIASAVSRAWLRQPSVNPTTMITPSPSCSGRSLRNPVGCNGTRQPPGAFDDRDVGVGGGARRYQSTRRSTTRNVAGFGGRNVRCDGRFEAVRVDGLVGHAIGSSRPVIRGRRCCAVACPAPRARRRVATGFRPDDAQAVARPAGARSAADTTVLPTPVLVPVTKIPGVSIVQYKTYALCDNIQYIGVTSLIESGIKNIVHQSRGSRDRGVAA